MSPFNDKCKSLNALSTGETAERLDCYLLLFARKTFENAHILTLAIICIYFFVYCLPGMTFPILVMGIL